MTRLVFKPLNVTSLIDPKVSTLQNNEFFIDDSNGLLYYKDSQGNIKNGVETEVNRFSNIRPSISLDFSNMENVDSRITFSRASKGSYINQQGNVAYDEVNIPRKSFDPMTLECRGLLLEKQGVNLLLSSQDYSDLVWSKSKNSLNLDNIALETVPNVISPDRNVTPTYRMYNIADGSMGTKSISQNIQVKQGSYYTFSGFVKADNSTCEVIRITGGGGFETKDSNGVVISKMLVSFYIKTGIIKDVTTGVVDTPIIEPYKNGWYRITFTGQATSTTSTGISLWMAQLQDIAPVNTQGVYFWGLQVQQGKHITQYTPTLPSTTQQIITEQDYCSLDPIYFSEELESYTGEGTIVLEFLSVGPKNNPNYSLLELIDSSNNCITITQSGDRPIKSVVISINGSTYTLDYTNLDVPNTYGMSYKIAFSFSKDTCYGSLNGKTTSNLSLPGIRMQINKLLLNDSIKLAVSSNTAYFSKVLYFRNQLSKEELVALTE